MIPVWFFHTKCWQTNPAVKVMSRMDKLINLASHRGPFPGAILLSSFHQIRDPVDGSCMIQPSQGSGQEAKSHPWRPDRPMSQKIKMITHGKSSWKYSCTLKQFKVSATEAIPLPCQMCSRGTHPVFACGPRRVLSWHMETVRGL